MSNLSTIYDALNTAVATALGSDYVKITNAYEPGNNDELLLDKAYGLAFDSAENTEREIGCNSFYVRQGYLVVLVNQLYANEHDTTAMANAEKSLVEDYIKVAKAIGNNVTLSESIATLQAGHGGVDVLAVDQNLVGPKYLVLSIVISTEFRESLT